MVDKLVNSEINTKRINNVEYCFGMSGVPLGVPGRVLVGEGVLTKICRKKPKSRQFFLFNDILVYGTILINEKKYAQQHIIPLEGLVVEDLPNEGGRKNGWLIKTSSKSFAVYAGTPSEKAEWIRHIKKCANDLLIQTGRTAPLEHAAVWIPDSIARVCMHCNTTQFTMINRRHHCRKCGSVICGNCSKNRVVILHQSNSPVRVCDTCYDKFYNHLKSKQISTPTLGQQKQRQLDNAAEIEQVVKTCVDDSIKKDSRVEEWVCLANEQMKEQQDSKKPDIIVNGTETINSKSAQTVEKIADDLKSADSDEKNEPDSNEDKTVDSYHNNHTSDSEDEPNDLGSMEDILEEEHVSKPTFYDEHSSRDLSIRDEINEKNIEQTNEKSSPENEYIVQNNETIESKELVKKSSSIGVENESDLSEAQIILIDVAEKATEDVSKESEKYDSKKINVNSKQNEIQDPETEATNVEEDHLKTEL